MMRSLGLATLILPMGVLVATLEAQEQIVTHALLDERGPEMALQRPANVALHGATIIEALLRLSEESNVPIAFSPTELSRSTLKVDCRCRDLTVREALDLILDGSAMDYTELRGQVIVYNRLVSQGLADPSVLTVSVGAPPSIGSRARVRLIDLRPQERQGVIVGQVTDARTGVPLSAVQVFLPDLDLGTLSQTNGRFTIPSVPAGIHRVSASRIGYAAATIETTVTSGQTSVVDFALTEEALGLDEIIVTGTAGAARRREIGNTVSQIRAEDLALESVVRTEDVLAASAPGVQMSLGGGDPGAGQTIRIRGINSLTQGNRPLIYIDGVRMESDPLPRQATGQAAGALNSINPEDIDRIEIVKGSSATTLYGTEASAGVIQIFTKRGSQGAARWNVEYAPSLVAPPRTIGPEPDPGWIERFRDGPGGLAGEVGLDARNLFMNPYTKTRMSNAVNVSVRGGSTLGSNPVNYFVSGGWSDEAAYYDKAGQRQLNLRTNLGYSPTDWLSIQSNTSLAQTHNVFVTSLALNVFGGANYVGGYTGIHHLFEDYDQEEWINHFTSGLEVRVTPTAALQVKLNLGIDYIDNRQTNTTYYGAFRDPLGDRDSRTWNAENKTLDLAATYTRDVLGLSSSTSAGFQVFQNSRNQLYGRATDLAGPGNPTVSFGSPWTSSEEWLKEVNAGFFFQEMVGFRDKLFLTMGLRMDGNSAFGKDYGLQSYPKASLSYVISEEGFWPSFFDDTKLRLAYGESGRAPGAFDAERTWNPVSANGGQPAVMPVSLGNPLLGPERTKEIEGGFETTFLDNRVTVDFTHYRQRTVDALIDVPVDPTNGLVASQIQNVGTVDNVGTEIQLDAAVLQSRSFGWDVGVGAAFSKSEVKDLGGLPQISLGSLQFAKVGYPLVAWFGDMVQNPNEYAAPILENEYVGPAYPTQLINVSTQFRIGQNLTLSARAERQAGHYVYGTSFWMARRSFYGWCWGEVVAEQEGRIDELTAEQRWRCAPTDINGSGHIMPADFWKVRSVNATYRLPANFLGGSLGQLTVSAGGRDLFNFFNSGFFGVDPEEQQGGDTRLTRFQCYRLPPPRVFTFSVRSEF